MVCAARRSTRLRRVAIRSWKSPAAHALLRRSHATPMLRPQHRLTSGPRRLLRLVGCALRSTWPHHRTVSPAGRRCVDLGSRAGTRRKPDQRSILDASQHGGACVPANREPTLLFVPARQPRNPIVAKQRRARYASQYHILAGD